jgi:hypothetical protein
MSHPQIMLASFSEAMGIFFGLTMRVATDASVLLGLPAVVFTAPASTTSARMMTPIVKTPFDGKAQQPRCNARMDISVN